MLRLIRDRGFQLAYRIAHALRVCWWRLAKPRIVGCQVLAFDEQGRLLLIRHSYGSRQWMLPGGGMKRGEDPLAAAAREMREETGCGLEDAREIAIADEPLHGARNRVHVVTGRALGMARPDGREVVEARFFAPGALPDQMPERLRERLADWLAASRSQQR